jgi:hypothetical protein
MDIDFYGMNARLYTLFCDIKVMVLSNLKKAIQVSLWAMQ